MCVNTDFTGTCNEGYYLDMTDAVCKVCPENTYQLAGATNLCSDCPAGWITIGDVRVGDEPGVCHYSKCTVAGQRGGPPF